MLVVMYIQEQLQQELVRLVDNKMTQGSLRLVNGRFRKKGNTPYKWYNPDKTKKYKQIQKETKREGENYVG